MASGGGRFLFFVFIFVVGLSVVDLGHVGNAGYIIAVSSSFCNNSTFAYSASFVSIDNDCLET